MAEEKTNPPPLAAPTAHQMPGEQAPANEDATQIVSRPVVPAPDETLATTGEDAATQIVSRPFVPAPEVTAATAGEDAATQIVSHPPAAAADEEDPATRIVARPSPEAPAVEAPPAPPAPPATQAPTPAVTPTQTGSSSGGGRSTTAVASGTRIMGTYEIEQLISKGGMGEVYRGRNIHTGDPVAIKIVLPHLAEDEMISQLFQKEAKVLGRLNADAIVRYHVFTNDPVIGRPSLIMEFVEGTSMNDRMKQGPMPEADVRTLLRRLASGLDKAHGVGVVHRDLSPDNVILQDGLVEHAKIIDFGIAKSSMKGTDATLLQGQFAGKFSFVAPEQLGAYGGTVDARTDIYSLALMMVAACQGRVLNMGKSIVEAVRARASVPDLPMVPEGLRPLIEHMLEPDPAMRPASMAEVIRLIDNPSEVPGRAAASATAADGTMIMPETAFPKPSAATGRPTGTDELFVGIPSGGKAQGNAAAVAKRGNGGLIGVAGAAVVVLALGGAWFGGLLGGGGTETDPAVNEGPGTPDTPKTPDTPPPDNDAGDGQQDANGTPGTQDTPKTPDSPPPVNDPGNGQQDANGTPGTPDTPKTPDTPPPDNDAGNGQQDANGTPGTPDTPKTPDTPPPVNDPGNGQQDANNTPGTPDTPKTPDAPPPGNDADNGQQDANGTPGTTAPVDAPKETDTAPPPPPPADPMDLQANWVRDYNAGSCAFVVVRSKAPPAVAMEGFARDVTPFAALLSEFTAEFAIEPALDTHVVNDPQCPIIDYMARLKSATDLPPSLSLDNDTGVVKSGEAVSGRIEGLAGRAVSLFLVNGVGGATNLRSFLAKASDGTVSFSFTVNLTPGSPPTPQVLIALVTQEPMTMLDVVPNGVTARALVPFIEDQIAKSRQDATADLRFFRIEN